ncbi:hypothetical protein PBR20603_04688 [Pandoraea bronchicola]|uniref:Flagellar motor switch protein FliN-like C-terminal domain-containing protein n=2 Tax=Pandoraea bronchicola TaxID=2508287 RepID=A0A5E5BWI3_9BURK|nr:hypothetical protein PBR20603_04688 [Pandoraea bronchicola]
MNQMASNGVEWRALQAWSDAQRERLAGHWRTQLAEFVATWSTRPVGAVDDFGVQVVPLTSAFDNAPQDVLALHSAQSVDAGAWLTGRTTAGARRPVHAMAAALFGQSPVTAGTASIGVACDALDALVRRLGFDRFVAQSDWPAGTLRAPWSGALGLRFSLGPSEWTVIALASTVQRWIASEASASALDIAAEAFDSRARGGLTKLSAALAHTQVSLRVRLDGPLLALGVLTDLREGDIVALPHALSMPLHVETPTGEPVCRAYLGRQKDRLAIELSDAHESSSLQESV